MKILNRNIILAFTVLVFMGSYTFAQKIDAKAKALLDAVSANYKSKKSNYFTFTYSTGSSKVQQKGTFDASGNKYALEITGTRQIFDGKKVYSINKEEKEITISKPNASASVFSPLNYIEEYRKGYAIKAMGTQRINGKQASVVRLTPTSSSEFRYISLYIDASKKQILKMQQVYKNNTSSSITVNSYKANASNGAAFSFDKSKYPDYVITEL
ncbi:LolA family protein [Riemerella columbipharyngis]|uniref:Outer membrane lipoprotein-sorting protein n=1 Tax=Riemerella columbipharyngis TaxID=1071918 RepID=A0A1G6YDB5_9FLAO|nr:outer membrane lipoprotein carrier protein LolA [Riemerella columbipharyngis]SDD88369.1 Outer membrane lipoprotein-sorting protein [Riemerella columbipharyngis]